MAGIKRQIDKLCALDAADNLHKGLLKETLGTVSGMMNVNVFYYTEVGIKL